MQLEADVYRAMVESAVNPFFLMEADGTISWASPPVEDLLGHRPEDMVGLNVLDLLDESSRLLALDALADIERLREMEVTPKWMGSGAVFSVRTASGDHLPCETALATPARTGLSNYVVQLRRASVQAAVNSTLEALGQMAPLTRVLELVAKIVERSIAEASVEVAHGFADGAFAHFDAPSLRLAGDDETYRWTGPWVDAVRTGEVVDAGLERLAPPLREKARSAGFNGCWVQPVPAPGDGQDTARAALIVWHGSLTPITTLTRLAMENAARMASLVLHFDDGRRALTHAAEHDALTGLPNRRGLVGRISSMGTDTMATLYLDLDDFKNVNDEHGHKIGDAVLEIIGERLRSAVRPDDFIARLGGDEFVVICPGTPGTESVTTLARRLIESVSQQVHLADIPVPIRVGASVGAVICSDGRTADQAIDAADGLLREAKRAGKGIVCLEGVVVEAGPDGTFDDATIDVSANGGSHHLETQAHRGWQLVSVEGEELDRSR